MGSSSRSKVRLFHLRVSALPTPAHPEPHSLPLPQSWLGARAFEQPQPQAQRLSFECPGVPLLRSRKAKRVRVPPPSILAAAGYIRADTDWSSCHGDQSLCPHSFWSWKDRVGWAPLERPEGFCFVEEGRETEPQASSFAVPAASAKSDRGGLGLEGHLLREG